MGYGRRREGWGRARRGRDGSEGCGIGQKREGWDRVGGRRVGQGVRWKG